MSFHILLIFHILSFHNFFFGLNVFLHILGSFFVADFVVSVSAYLFTYHLQVTYT